MSPYLQSLEEPLSMLARNVVESAIKDMENFFIDEANFRVAYELDCSDVNIASVRSAGGKARMCFSIDLCNYEVNDAEKLLFILFIVSHELAHFISCHHIHNDQQNLDSVSIEARADFFGVQIALTLLTFGSNIHELINKSEDFELGSGVHPKNVVDAILNLKDFVFSNNTSPKYPSSPYRVMSMLAASIAFFAAYSRESEDRYDIAFIRELRNERNINRLQLICDYGQTINSITDKIEEIHNKLQWNNPFSVGGFKMDFVPYLATNYILPKGFRDKQKASSKKQFSQLFYEATGVNVEK